MKRSISTRDLARLMATWQSVDAGSAYERLAAGIRAAILDGRIPVGARLPAERALAAELELSRTTVSAAYRKLAETGFLVARQGSGSVTAMPADRPRTWTAFGPVVDPSTEMIDLAIAAPGAEPGLLQDATAAALEALPGYLAGIAATADHGYHPAGVGALRQLIADRYTRRGLPTSAGQILVTTGAQGAIDLLARHLLSPRDVAVLESPTYPNAITALRHTGARLVPAPVLAEGYDVELLAETLNGVRPRLAHLVPDFHNPTGALLGTEGRMRMAEAARATTQYLVIDETLADLPLDGQEMPPPVAAFDTDGRIITIGSLGKSFWGGLRVGWVRAGGRLVEQLAATRSSIDLASASINQLIAAALLERADELLPPRRALFARRRDHLSTLLTARFPEWRWAPPTGGLCFWVDLGVPMATALADAGERAGVRLASGSQFGIDGAFEGRVRLPYTYPEADLDVAVDRLANAMADLRFTRPGLGSVPTIA